MTKYPKFYGGTVDPETGVLYDARKKPPVPEPANVKARRRSKAKAARQARRKKNR
jgi:hypothetical protein